jgi:hypothetical protein
VVATAGFHPVIYIIIASNMAARMTLSTAQKTSNNSERFRTGLILGGIVVAIIVSIFLTQDTGPESGLHSWLPQFTANVKLVANSVPSITIESISSSIAGLLKF